jgi:hypothetical protein
MMKILFVLSLAFSVMLLLFMFSGCAATDDDAGDSLEESETSFAGLPKPIAIGFGDELDSVGMRNELEELIRAAKTANRGDENYALYSQNRVSDIEEFFFPMLPTSCYKLVGIGVLGGGISFSYVSHDWVERNNHSAGNYVSVISKSIVRSDAGLGDMPRSPSLENIARVFRGEIRDGLVYRENEHLTTIAGLIGDTWFYMYIPAEFGNFETMRESVHHAVETAELVTVR